MRTNATSLKNKLGKYIDASITEPVIVEKFGRPTSVLISFDYYEKLSKYEDFYWGFMAKEAEKEGYLGVDESAKILKEIEQSTKD